MQLLDYNYNIILINSIKKKLLNILKNIGYRLLILHHGSIRGVIDSNNHKFVQVINSTLGNKYSYNIYKITNGRIYSDTVTDTAFILNNKVVNGPTFQHRHPKNAEVFENIVFLKGTPKFKKKLKGTIFSLLTGGAGNANYWHWMFDVLPRLKILENKINLQEIDYFLFPSLKKKFQIETLNYLNIPDKKRISSISYRHIQTDTAIAVDHPYVFENNASIEIQNLPMWILEYLRNKFVKKKNLRKFSSKFYIDRKDSNHSHIRKIINEDEVKEYLVNKGFSIISLGELDFEDQVNLFNNAEQIVGLHGAGFANLTFCNSKTLALELKPAEAGPVIGNLAKKLNLNYQDISIDPLGHSEVNQQGFIKIPLNLLEKKLS